jgi:hypothetical protein
MNVSLLILAAALALPSSFAIAQQDDGNGLSLGKSMPGEHRWCSVSRSRSDNT